MEEIHKDERASLFPLGLVKPPHNWGTTQHGKLTADQWGVIATKSLVVTLVRHWGYRQASPNTHADVTKAREKAFLRKRAMLWNFVDMVKASLMAHNRVTSVKHAESYQQHIYRYFREVSALYPSFSMTPSAHISLHFDDYLKRIGPSHAYKVPGFERMNYEMQSTNTNGKLGTMILASTCLLANSFLKGKWSQLMSSIMLNEQHWPV
jgi:hypothetical protein